MEGPPKTLHNPMYNPGDQVEVLNSKRGYKGPGQIVDQAHSNYYLVKVEIEGKPTVITARFQDLRRSSTTNDIKSKKK